MSNPEPKPIAILLMFILYNPLLSKIKIDILRSYRHT